MHVFIAGPMRGLPEFNFPQFYAAEARLIDAGYKAFNPARHDVEEAGFEYRGLKGDEDLSILGFSLSASLADDLLWLTHHADAICVLPGWRDSRQAVAMVALAAALDLLAGDVQQFLDRDLIAAGTLGDPYLAVHRWDEARLSRLLAELENHGHGDDLPERVHGFLTPEPERPSW